jgi:hypothetical protein
MTGDDERAEKVRKQLMVTEDQVFQEMLTKAEKLLRLDEKGRIHPRVKVSELGNKQKVELYLVGRYLGKAGRLTSDDTAKANEIAQYFGVDVVEVQRRTSDLKGEGKIESPARGSYRLVLGRIAEIFKDLGVD